MRDDDGLPPLLFWTIAVVATIGLIVSRRPDGIWSPQFWAEDGKTWYAQAYNEGWFEALQIPAAGYLQSFSRLVAALSLAVDLRHAPLVFNVAAVLAQALAPLYLLSARFAHAIPDRRVRVLAALLVVGAPNGFEIQSNVTNTQTHLALLSALIVLAERPRGRAAALFDLFFLVLGGLSGPTCVLLVPIAALAWFRRRSPWRLVVLLALLLPAGAQLATYWWTGGAGRFTTPLGATTLRLLQILGGQVFTAGTLGAKVYARLLSYREPYTSTGTTLLGIAGLAFMARVLWVGDSITLRLFVLFAALALAAGLASPAVGMVPRWQALRLPNAGIRYFAPAILAYLATLLWAACADRRPLGRWSARVLLGAVLLVGMPLDWRVAPRADLDFASEAARFAAAPPGTEVTIPIPPVPWKMKLDKR